jgi:ribosomal protein S18 acetylase RimI-like enzyme
VGVGHITQVCIVPEFRRRGLGLRLMEASIQALKSRKYHALSLTVTAANENAVRLYERMGFQTLRTFTAAVWQE